MRKSIISLIAIFYFSLFYSQSKLADILYSNFEYASAAKVYSQSKALTQKQKRNFAFCYYYNNEFQKSIPIFKTLKKLQPRPKFDQMPTVYPNKSMKVWKYESMRV